MVSRGRGEPRQATSSPGSWWQPRVSDRSSHSPGREPALRLAQPVASVGFEPNTFTGSKPVPSANWGTTPCCIEDKVIQLSSVQVAGFEPAFSCSQSRRDGQSSLHPGDVVLATLHEINEDVKSSSPPDLSRTLHPSYPAKASPGAQPGRRDSGAAVVERSKNKSSCVEGSQQS